jgi:hypothetical protein
MDATYQVGIQIFIQGNAEAQLSAMGRQFTQANAGIVKLQTHLNSLHSNLSKIGAMGSVGANMFRESKEAMEAMLKPGEEVTQQISKMNQAGLSHVEIMKNVAEAYKTVARVSSVTPQAVLQTMGETRNILQTPGKDGRPDLKKGNGGGLGAEEADRQGGNAVRLSELRGQTTLKQIEHNVQESARTYAASQGQIDPGKLMQALKFAGPLKQTMNDTALFGTMSEFILENQTGRGGGASRAGVMMQSVGRSLVQGHMTKALAANLDSYGLLNQVPPDYAGTQTIASVVGGDLLKSNPDKWMHEVFLPKLLAAHPNLKGDRVGQSGAIMSFMTGSGMFTSAMQDLNNKHGATESMVARRQQVGSFDDLLQRTEASNPKLAQVAVEASWNTFMGVLGQAMVPILIPALTEVTKVLKVMTAWALDNPAMVKNIVLMVAGLGALGAVMAVVAAPFAAVGSIVTAVLGVVAIFGLVDAFLPEIGLALAALAIVNVAAVFAFSHWTEIMKTVQPIMNSVSKAFTSFFQFIFDMANRIPGVHIAMPDFSKPAAPPAHVAQTA